MPKPKLPKPKRGRPSAYTPELGAAICELLASGKSLMEICRSPKMPPESTVRRWAQVDISTGFAAEYARARDIGLDCQADAILAVARDKKRDPRDRQVEIDALKWRLCKLAPKRYGDRLELAGDKDAPLQITVTRLDRA